jgi:hypothetical protein
MGPEADNSSPSSVEIKKDGNNVLLPSYVSAHMGDLQKAYIKRKCFKIALNL